jgi:hypothetical protein
VEILSAILQFADSLDRSHRQPVRTLLVRTVGAKLMIDATVDAEEVYVERWSSERRAEVLEVVLGREVSLSFTPLTGAGVAGAGALGPLDPSAPRLPDPRDVE